ncbi:flavin reductase family protein [Bradyrhizobium sp.]|uniref:flavin reductase family protein n=1 Tax=Bradyrhizobium sp. TaxID=376 RepID=UPI0039E44545
MFFDPQKNDHGLPRDPFKACIVPRPIGWVSTISASGVENLAPYSFFNAVAEFPRMVMVCVNANHADGRQKDTVVNVRQVPEFVVNLATWSQREAMNLSCAPVASEVDEFDLASLEKLPSRLVRPSRVAKAGIGLECRLHQIIDLPTTPSGEPNAMMIGNVVGIHIDDEIMTDGRIDMKKLKPIARLGYSEYAVVGADNIFAMRRPNE